MKTITQLFLFFATVSYLQSCKEKEPCKDPRNASCENYNPCVDSTPTSAAFTIKDDTYLRDWMDPFFADWDSDTDTTYQTSIHAEAHIQNADSYTWKIDHQPDQVNRNNIYVHFEDEFRGSWITIRLIVKRKPSKSCFPNDDGIDTVTRRYYIMRYNEPLNWEGTYYGSDDDKPDSLYTIVLGHSYDVNKRQDFIKIYGLPRGCTDTLNERITGKDISYNNVNFDSSMPDLIGINCYEKSVEGVYKNNNQYTIRQQYVWRVNGDVNIKRRIFKGVKIQ
ncbi:MAG: hypothetical protein SGJ00_13390 [bacterium]|nr:hypothetical protein [bacterium]